MDVTASWLFPDDETAACLARIARLRRPDSRAWYHAGRIAIGDWHELECPECRGELVLLPYRLIGCGPTGRRRVLYAVGQCAACDAVGWSDDCADLRLRPWAELAAATALPDYSSEPAWLLVVRMPPGLAGDELASALRAGAAAARSRLRLCGVPDQAVRASSVRPINAGPKAGRVELRLEVFAPLGAYARRIAGAAVRRAVPGSSGRWLEIG